MQFIILGCLLLFLSPFFYVSYQHSILYRMPRLIPRKLSPLMLPAVELLVFKDFRLVKSRLVNTFCSFFLCVCTSRPILSPVEYGKFDYCLEMIFFHSEF